MAGPKGTARIQDCPGLAGSVFLLLQLPLRLVCEARGLHFLWMPRAPVLPTCLSYPSLSLLVCCCIWTCVLSLDVDDQFWEDMFQATLSTALSLVSHSLGCTQQVFSLLQMVTDFSRRGKSSTQLDRPP